jgi:hypothetical protein
MGWDGRRLVELSLHGKAFLLKVEGKGWGSFLVYDFKFICTYFFKIDHFYNCGFLKFSRYQYEGNEPNKL